MIGNEKEMIDFYLQKRIKVHVKLSTGKFYNGYFIGWENSSVAKFNDRVIGEVYVFISQIEDLEEFREASE